MIVISYLWLLALGQIRSVGHFTPDVGLAGRRGGGVRGGRQTPAARPAGRVRCALASIAWYQRTLAVQLPLFGVSCRFVPTCSRYAHAVIGEHGLWTGARAARSLWTVDAARHDGPTSAQRRRPATEPGGGDSGQAGHYWTEIRTSTHVTGAYDGVTSKRRQAPSRTPGGTTS